MMLEVIRLLEESLDEIGLGNGMLDFNRTPFWREKAIEYKGKVIMASNVGMGSDVRPSHAGILHAARVNGPSLCALCLLGERASVRLRMGWHDYGNRSRPFLRRTPSSGCSNLWHRTKRTPVQGLSKWTPLMSCAVAI